MESGRKRNGAFVTGDGTLHYEQNLTGRRLAIVALSTDNWPILKNHVPAILAAIDSAVPGSVQTVECGRFSRKQPQETQIDQEPRDLDQEQDRER